MQIANIITLFGAGIHRSKDLGKDAEIGRLERPKINSHNFAKNQPHASWELRYIYIWLLISPSIWPAFL